MEMLARKKKGIRVSSFIINIFIGMCERRAIGGKSAGEA